MNKRAFILMSIISFLIGGCNFFGKKSGKSENNTNDINDITILNPNENNDDDNGNEHHNDEEITYQELKTLSDLKSCFDKTFSLDGFRITDISYDKGKNEPGWWGIEGFYVDTIFEDLSTYTYNFTQEKLEYTYAASSSKTAKISDILDKSNASIELLEAMGKTFVTDIGNTREYSYNERKYGNYILDQEKDIFSEIYVEEDSGYYSGYSLEYNQYFDLEESVNGNGKYELNFCLDDDSYKSYFQEEVDEILDAAINSKTVDFNNFIFEDHEYSI